jgi:hypothetical protein
MPTPRKYSSDADRQRAFRQRQRDARTAALVSNAPPPPAIPTMPGTARWKALHDQARAAIQTMAEEMQSYHDNLSETWQEGDKGEAFREMIERADELRETIEEFTLEA